MTKSREIRFRVWGKPQGFYLPTLNDCNYQLFQSREECLKLERGRGIGFVHLGWAIKGPDAYVVEQFTGLKDSKGVDIYEGDIIRYAYPADGQNLVEVRWSREGEDYHPGFHMADLMTQGGPCEVVGNVHQHAHLLEDSAQ